MFLLLVNFNPFSEPSQMAVLGYGSGPQSERSVPYRPNHIPPLSHFVCSISIARILVSNCLSFEIHMSQIPSPGHLDLKDQLEFQYLKVHIVAWKFVCCDSGNLISKLVRKPSLCAGWLSELAHHESEPCLGKRVTTAS